MLYRIGETAQKTGISEYALRQWSNRYQIEASHQSKGGQRLYSEADVQRLKLLKLGKAKGMLLNEMAKLSVQTLDLMLMSHEASPFYVWVGDEERRYHAHFPGLRWLRKEDAVNQPHGTVVFVCETMTEDSVKSLEHLTCRVEVFATYISRPIAKALNAQTNINIHREKPTEDWFVSLVETVSGKAMYSQTQLQTFIQTTPNMECECPNHIATILKNLRHFAEYSLECEVTSAEQAWIHKKVFDHIQNAQIEVEEALKLVIHEEGLV